MCPRNKCTAENAPNIAGYNAHLDNLARRRVIIDDDNDNQNGSLTPFQADGQQFLFFPRANGGFSVGTQGVDFFRGGDLVNGLTGVLHWSFSGLTGTEAWRIRPAAATPAAFTVTNPRPVLAPSVGGAVKAAGMNLLNYFTTIDTTSSSTSGPCGPDGLQDCRGADSVAELNRQRDRASRVVCGLNADAFGFAELENTNLNAITDLLGAINTQCGFANPYAFATTGGTLGTDAIRVAIIYRTGRLSPVGAACPWVSLTSSRYASRARSGSMPFASPAARQKRQKQYALPSRANPPSPSTLPSGPLRSEPHRMPSMS